MKEKEELKKANKLKKSSKVNTQLYEDLLNNNDVSLGDNHGRKGTSGGANINNTFSSSTGIHLSNTSSQIGEMGKK